MSILTPEEFRVIEKRFETEFDEMAEQNGPLGWSSTSVMMELHDRLDWSVYRSFLHECERPVAEYQRSLQDEAHRRIVLRNGIMAALFRTLFPPDEESPA
jgi:hypothetical protein